MARRGKQPQRLRDGLFRIDVLETLAEENQVVPARRLELFIGSVEHVRSVAQKQPRLGVEVGTRRDAVHFAPRIGQHLRQLPRAAPRVQYPLDIRGNVGKQKCGIILLRRPQIADVHLQSGGPIAIMQVIGFQQVPGQDQANLQTDLSRELASSFLLHDEHTDSNPLLIVRPVTFSGQ